MTHSDPATPKPLLRVLLLLRYSEEDDGKSQATQTIMQTMWPDHAIEVTDSATAFKAAKGQAHGFAGWVRYAATDVSAAGPTFHAFAIVDPVLGFTSGEIIEMGGAHARPCFLIDLVNRAWTQVTKLEACVSTKKKHDWRVVG